MNNCFSKKNKKKNWKEQRNVYPQISFYFIKNSMKKIIYIILTVSIIWLVWCSKTPRIQQGDKVTISYVGTLENGEIFENETRTITVGSWEIIKWIEDALINKKSDKRFSIEITPEKWYAYLYSLHNQQRISPLIFEKLWLSTETGTMVTLDKITGKIIGHEWDKNGNTMIIVDINPPQTRQETHYDIHIENIEKNQTEESYVL